eukprot:12455783-Alexandrium_andersonii.AAC.1
MKALSALGQSAPGTSSGLIPGFFEAFSERAGDPDVDLAPWSPGAKLPNNDRANARTYVEMR